VSTAPRPITGGTGQVVIEEPLTSLPGRTRTHDLAVKIAMIITVALGIRYFEWRWTETFNPEAPIFWWVFVIAETQIFVSGVLFYLTTWNITRYADEVPLPRRSVDVFIATYNEPLVLLRDTIVAAKQIEYPHRTVVLDDGNRPEVAQLAKEHACIYLPREENTHAKAGNLNNGLENSKAEFVVTLDADHVPSPNLIDELLGYFKDPKVGAVQANQDFYNMDSFQHVLDWKKRIGWQMQEIFFGVVQPGKDALNGVIYCGSPAMLRRSALDDVGGFATGTITEDIHTGIRLQKRGWRIVYVNKSVARGLSPQTFLGYETQWNRWGLGSMQVFRIDNAIFGRGLTFGQRLAYLASYEYNVLFSWAKLIAIGTVIYALFSGTFPLLAVPLDYFWHYLPYLGANIITASALAGVFISPILTERYNVVKIMAQLDTITGLLRRNAEFRVTPKAVSRATRIGSGWVYIVMLGLLYGGTLVGIVNMIMLQSGGRFWAYAVTALFASYYFWVVIPGVARAVRRKEERSQYRFPGELEIPTKWEAYVLEDGESVPPGGTTFARNANRDGLSLTIDRALPRGSYISVEMELHDRTITALAEVMRVSSFLVGMKVRYANGCRFVGMSRQDGDALVQYLFTDVAPRHGTLMQITTATQQVGRAEEEAQLAG